MMGSATILPPKEFRREMDRVRAGQPDLFVGKSESEAVRYARNYLMCMKVYERADYGLFADVRELIALRIAPWLRGGRS